MYLIYLNNVKAKAVIKATSFCPHLLEKGTWRWQLCGVITQISSTFLTAPIPNDRTPIPLGAPSSPKKTVNVRRVGVAGHHQRLALIARYVAARGPEGSVRELSYAERVLDHCAADE